MSWLCESFPGQNTRCLMFSSCLLLRRKLSPPRTSPNAKEWSESEKRAKAETKGKSQRRPRATSSAIKQSQGPPKKWFPRVLLPLASTGPHCLHEAHDRVLISQGFHSLMQLSYDYYYHPPCFFFFILDNDVLVNVNNQCPKKVQIEYK